MTTTERVTRYVVTYVHPRDGMRTLAFPAQGRYTYETRAEAEQVQRLFFKPGDPDGADRVRSIFGPDPRFEVRPCECWPVHFDPVGVYFD